jgi:hypothetical protein
MCSFTGNISFARVSGAFFVIFSTFQREHGNPIEKFE